MDFISAVRDAGVIGAGGAGFPSHAKLNAKAQYILLNGAECEPLLRVDQQIMDVFASEILEGFFAAGKHLGAEKALIGVKRKHSALIEKLNKMDFLALVAAFGGGVIGAYMGALPAFIMTGVFALVGGVVTAAGAPADIAVGTLAFGSLLGPHIAFAGGVAAAGYAGKKKELASGADITASLNGLGSPDVLLVGGLFGIIGYLIVYLIGLTPFGALTDQPGFAVCVLGIASRFIFGSTGLTGKFEGEGKREWISPGKGMASNIVLGGSVGIAVSFIAASLAAGGASDTVLGIFPIICFGFSAVTLIFAQTGSACPATHHISLPAALAALAGIGTWGSAGALLGVAFGIICAVLGDFFGKSLNSYCDTHIDPPATTIWTMTIVISLIKAAIS